MTKGTDPHAPLERAVAEADAAAAGIEILVASAAALVAGRRRDLEALERELDAGAMGGQLEELVRQRGLLAGELSAADRALAGREARLREAQEVRAGAVRALAQARLAAGIEALRAADDVLMQELLAEVRKVAAKSVALAARDAELRELLAPAGYLGANAAPFPDLMMATGQLPALGQVVVETFDRERGRLLAHHNGPAASGAAEKEV